jgi:hypothetical protein
MHLGIQELLEYTSGERAKWKAWFLSERNAVLKRPAFRRCQSSSR